jgi:hypothetical protein
VTDPLVWVLDWTGPANAGTNMSVALNGTGLTPGTGANLPQNGTITAFTIFNTNPLSQTTTMFSIAGLSISAADFATAAAANLLGDVLLGGDEFLSGRSAAVNFPTACGCAVSAGTTR